MAKSQYQSLKDDASKFCKCSIKTRIIGYVVCFAVGWLLSIGATIMFFVKHNIPVFAVLFSLGQILNITGYILYKFFRSCFLATPKTQIKDMFKKARIWFTIAYLGSTILTIVLACTLPENLRFIIVISILVQIASYFFYTLSYIPYGQKILGKICKFMADSD